MAEGWSKQEVEATVADYFAMLKAELLGEPYSKASHRRRLVPKLNGRSEQSVEFKHCNVSAILVQMHLPYIDGYKPRGNYQQLLRDEVEQFLLHNPSFFADLAHVPMFNPTELPRVKTQGVFVPPPEPTQVTGKVELASRVGQIDFVMRDAMNRRLGELGERWVLDLEKRRLVAAGRDDLAKKVEWVSNTRGDGLGYDIVSFDPVIDDELHVEVKTTTLGRHFPFLVTANEVQVSARDVEAYRLYRVFGFSKDPKVYVLKGSIEAGCSLEPILYRTQPLGTGMKLTTGGIHNAGP